MFFKNCVYYLVSIIKKYLISRPLYRKKQTLQKKLGFEKCFNNEAKQIILKIKYSVYVNNIITMTLAHRSKKKFNFLTNISIFFI